MKVRGMQFMKNLTVCLLVLLGAVSANGQQWSNPENQMLSDSLSSFMFYSTNTPVPFSDPNSLRDTERRAAISDQYHEESEAILAQAREYRRQQQLQQLQQFQNMQNYQNMRYGNGRGPGRNRTVNYNFFNVDGQQNIIMGYQNNFEGSMIP